ncbi:MAG TPA: tetratricopeptide repeat protein [Bryobacteraceae bacterium]|nr:tetratricopeptide repeat protein [Bryobacteraceae bacterium]
MRLPLVTIGCVALGFAADTLPQIFEHAARALTAGDYRTAEAGFQTVLDRAPGHIGAMGNLGVIYSRTNRPEKAIAMYRRALRLAPDDKQLLMNLGLVYLKQESYLEARTTFNKVVSLDPNNARARELLATAQLSSGRIEPALRTLEQLHAADPGNAGVLYLLGVAYLKHKEPEKAQRTLEQVIETVPPAKANFLLGRAYYESARFDDAAAHYQETLRIDPQYPGAHLELGKTYLSERLPQAESELRLAIQQNPNDAEAHYYLGACLAQQNRLDEAVPLLEHARDLNPGLWGAYFYLAKARLQQNQIETAISLLQSAAAMNPDEASIYYELGRALAKRGRTAEAAKAMARVREIKQQNLQREMRALQKP